MGAATSTHAAAQIAHQGAPHAEYSVRQDEMKNNNSKQNNPYLNQNDIPSECPLHAPVRIVNF